MLFAGIAQLRNDKNTKIITPVQPSFILAYWTALDAGRKTYEDGSYFVHVDIHFDNPRRIFTGGNIE